MTNPTNWPSETGSEWHTHFIYCPYCNHRQQGVGCKRNDCVPAITTIREHKGMDRVRCIQCGKRFWFNDGRDPENGFGGKKWAKNLRHFGTVNEYLDAHDFICSICGEILFGNVEWTIGDGWSSLADSKYRYESLFHTGQVMVNCSCGARQLIRVPSGVARVVRKDGVEERWGND